MRRPDALHTAVPALFMLLAGCSVAPRAFVDPVEPPPAFSGGGSDPLPDRWWESFDDPQLTALMERAFGGNFALLAAWDRLAQAEAIARSAGADLIPSVDVEAGISRTGEERFDRSDYATSMSLGATAAYEIDLWGRIRSRRAAAQLDAEARAEDVLAAAITLSAQVARTWYELAESREQIRVLNAQIETNEQVRTLVTAQFAKGQTQAADVLRQRQLVESSRGARILAESRSKVLEHELAVLVGLPPGSPLPAGAPELVDLPALPATGVPAELIRRRPDVRSAYLEVQAADLRVSQAVADRYPRLTIAAFASTSGEKVRDLFDNWLATLAADLIQPIVDGGRRRAEIDRTRAVTSQVIREYGQTVLDAIEEVEDALSQERYQISYLESLKLQLETAKSVIGRTRENYIKGQFDYLRVLDALTTRQSLERAYVTALRQRIDFRINLCRALAGGWTLPRPALADVGAPVIEVQPGEGSR